MRTLSIGIVVTLLAGTAFAQGKDKPAAAPAAAPAAGAPDMMKNGPWTRPVTKDDKKGIEAFAKSMDDAWKKNDINAVADLVDFPVTMMSDNAKGEEKHIELTHDQFVETFKPMVSQPPPPDMKMAAKHTGTQLSDNLGLVVSDVSMTMGKQKSKWKGFVVVVNKDGKWKAKQMCEAGWGDTVKAPEAPKAAAAPAKGPVAPIKK